MSNNMDSLKKLTQNENNEQTEENSSTHSQILQEQLLQSLLIRDLNTFQEILTHPEVDPAHKYGPPHWSSCLEIACRQKGCEEFIEVLLKSGVKPNVNTLVPEPIHYAAKNGNDDALKILLWDKRTKINATDSFGRTALHLAAKNYGQRNEAERYERCIALLMSRSDLHVNQPNKKGCTAIYEAAHFGGREAVIAMLKHGYRILDLDSSRGIGKSARQVLMEKYPDLKNLLPPARIEQLQSDSHSQLLATFQQRDLNAFRDLLCQVDVYGNARLDPNFYYNKPYNSTCLEMACKEIGCEDFVYSLLLAGADPNTANIITKKSPLHIAVENRNSEAVQILLQDKRVNVNVFDEHGRTPLHTAAEQHLENNNDTERLKASISFLLQQVKTDVNLTDKHGYSAIHLATLQGNEEFVELILKSKGPELDLERNHEPDGKTTSDMIRENFPNAKKFLPQKSIIEDHENALKDILFHYLYKQQTEEFIMILKTNIKKDNIFPIQEYDDGSFTLLQYACNYGLTDAVHALLECGAKPNATSEHDKRPPIILACMRNYVEALKCFLELPTNSDFNINATDAKGNTALHYAARNVDLPSVVALLNHGADIKIKNVFSQPPLPPETVEILLNHSLRTNDLYPEDEDYELIFNFNFLLAYNKQECLGKIKTAEDTVPLVKNQDEELFEGSKKMLVMTPEMDLVYNLSQAEEYRHLLIHPIVTSFLHLKWFKIRATYFTNLALYIFFLVLLNMYVLMYYDYSIENNELILDQQENATNQTKDNAEENDKQTILARFQSTYGNIIWLILLFILFCHTVRELYKFAMSPSRYLMTLDNLLDIALVFITTFVLFNSWENEENKKLFTAFCLFLSWIELALLVGRLPIFSINIQMLKSVSSHYLFIFLSYFFIIIAFGVSFYIFYFDDWESQRINNSSSIGNDTNNLGSAAQASDILQRHTTVLSNVDEKQTLWTSVTQASLFVAGGFSATFIPIGHGYSFIMLILFTFIVIMVMINILTGVAMIDVKYVQDNSEKLCIVSRITLMYEIESVLIYWNRFMERLCTFKCTSKMTSYLNDALKKIMLFPDVNPLFKQVSVLPHKNGRIIFPTENCAIPCKINVDILKSAISIIGSKGKISDMDQIKENLNEKHNEGLQKISECNYVLEKIQNKIQHNNLKIDKLEIICNNLQGKTNKSYKALDANMKSLIEQTQLQLAQTQKHLQEQLDQYERRFNWMEVSHKQTTELLTEVLNILNHPSEENT